MNSESITQKIGEIVVNFVEVEFIISDISYQLGLTEDKMEFFANSRTGQKISDMKKKFRKSKIEKKEIYIELLHRLDQIRIKRNEIVHALVLENPDNTKEYKSFYYKNGQNQNIIHNISDKKNEDFIDLNNDILKFKKEFCTHFYNEKRRLKPRIEIIRNNQSL